MKRILELLCGLLSGGALFAIMALTFFDVLGRKLLSNSITGSLELTELLMVVVIFGALPLVSGRGEHVEFDSLDPWLPRWVRRAQRFRRAPALRRRAAGAGLADVAHGR
jgi:TRAP-type transport system small permease protein